MYPLKSKKFIIGKSHPLTWIVGLCVIETEEHTLRVAEELNQMISPLFPFIFKASYDKANRSSHQSFRGPGLEEGLKILERVKREFGIAITTDAHSPEEALAVGEVCDMVQIPALLCRQTDLLLAAGKSGKMVNIKKGQFMAPWDMKNAAEKVTSTKNEQVLLTERGTSFGYNNLVSDFRSIPIMQDLGFPVCFDASHSVQLPASKGTHSGGQVEFTPLLAKAAVACGCDALFIEAHPNPPQAKSDSHSVLSFSELSKLLIQIQKLRQALQS